MNASSLRDSQMAMASYLRNPDSEPAPAGIEGRRLKIYQDLVYNNIEGFISSGFPVLRSLYADADWHTLVRLFIDQHRCHTPYFLEISQEFIRFLMEVHEPRTCDPVFAAELAHYEWVELALDVAEDEHGEPQACPDMGSSRLTLSPLAWLLSYRFPVHRIGQTFQPEQAGDPSYLVVYRDREDQVQFMEINAASARLLELLRDDGGYSAQQHLAQLAKELQSPELRVAEFGMPLLADLYERGIVQQQVD